MLGQGLTDGSTDRRDILAGGFPTSPTFMAISSGASQGKSQGAEGGCAETCVCESGTTKRHLSFQVIPWIGHKGPISV